MEVDLSEPFIGSVKVSFLRDGLALLEDKIDMVFLKVRMTMGLPVTIVTEGSIREKDGFG